MEIRGTGNNIYTPQANEVAAAGAREAATSAGPAKAGRDKVSVSSNAQVARKAADAAKESPDVRADRVAEIKAQMANGTYHVDAGRIADKLLEGKGVGSV